MDATIVAVEVAALGEIPTERLEAEVTELAGHLAAAECRWIMLIGELDRREAWASWGCRSCAHWLNWQCGLSFVAARDRLRIARALTELPLISAEFAAGRLSYSKVRAITRVATAEDEADLVTFARDATAAMLERFVRGYRGALARSTDAAVAAHDARRLSFHTDYDDGSLVISARLPPEVGAIVVEALSAACEVVDASIAGDSAESPEQRRADALGVLAEAALGGGLKGGRSAAERHQVVVHADIELLCATPDQEEDIKGQRCHIEDGPALASETARRLACDGGVVLCVEGADGNPLNMGRRTRMVPPALRRALHVRDKGCRFPGCNARAVRCDVHHLEHWVHGGEHSIWNTVLLCEFHHTCLHEGGYTCELLRTGEARFYRPDGTLIPPEPACASSPQGPDIHERNTAAGITIAPETITGTWDGTRLDLGYAVACYLN